MVAHHFGVVGVVGSNPAVPIRSFNYQSESFTNDSINLAVLIRTARKIKRVKKIIKTNNEGGILISPKETINKQGKRFTKVKINQ